MPPAQRRSSESDIYSLFYFSYSSLRIFVCVLRQHTASTAMQLPWGSAVNGLCAALVRFSLFFLCFSWLHCLREGAATCTVLSFFFLFQASFFSSLHTVVSILAKYLTLFFFFQRRNLLECVSE